MAESHGRRVVINRGLAKQFGKIATKDRAKLLHWLKIWCDDVDGAIPRERLKSQDHYTDDKGKRVHILAFKSFQARLYGFSRSTEGKETFFVTDVDPQKKDDNADPKILSRASKEAFRILGVLRIR